MIHVLLPAVVAGTLAEYLGYWGRDVAARIAVHRFEALVPGAPMPAGTWIFSGVEQLGPSGRRLASLVADQLALAPGVRVLNHPDRVLHRAPLLRQLHDRGVNRFQALPVSGPLDRLRFPAFLRRASRHDGAVSPLLMSRREVDAALGRAVLVGHPVDDLLAVEYLETGIDGVYRKYAAFIVGDRVIPRHLVIGRDWMLKYERSEYSRAMVEEELAYVTQNPHADVLAKVAAMAGVQYGRIDYALLDGCVQVWEINLAPTIGRGSRPSRRHIPPELDVVRQESKRRFYGAFAEAFVALDTIGAGAAAIDVTIPPALLEACRAEQAARPVQPPGAHWIPAALRAILEPVVAVGAPLVGRLARRRAIAPRPQPGRESRCVTAWTSTPRWP